LSLGGVAGGGSLSSLISPHGMLAGVGTHACWEGGDWAGRFVTNFATGRIRRGWHLSKVGREGGIVDLSSNALGGVEELCASGLTSLFM
jgi:hypothetical protein